MNNEIKSTLGSRIKDIREYFKLTQDSFGKRISSARNTIANYEMGNREPKGAVISLICKEFGVNEVALRTGEGWPENMFTKVEQEDRYSISLGKLTVSQNEFIHNAVNYLAEAEPEKLKVLEEFMKECLGIKK